MKIFKAIEIKGHEVQQNNGCSTFLPGAAPVEHLSQNGEPILRKKNAAT
ncbi:hypothetical protein [Microvirga sp. 2TAF3]